MKITRDFAHCAAVDAANRAMRRVGRTAWGIAESAVYVSTFTHLWPLELDYPWATPEELAEMSRQLGYDHLTDTR